MTGEPGDAGVSANLGGYGGADMHFGAMERVNHGLANGGRDFDTAWRGLHERIIALEAQIGNPTGGDILSAEFRNQYNPAAESLTQAQNDSVEELRRLASDGADAYTQYQNADARTAQTMRSSARA